MSETVSRDRTPRDLPLHDLSPADITWLRRLFAGRSAEDVARLKALLEAHCAPLAATPPDPGAAPVPGTASAADMAPPGPEELSPDAEGLSPAAQLALLGITDDLGALRAHLIALDMACADLQDSDDRNALRTTADTILTHLHTIRETLDHLRGAPPRN